MQFLVDVIEICAGIQPGDPGKRLIELLAVCIEPWSFWPTLNERAPLR